MEPTGVRVAGAGAAALRRWPPCGRRSTRKCCSGGRGGRAAISRKDYLRTAAERAFYAVLLQAVGHEWRVFAKVRLADLLWLSAGIACRQAAWNRGQSKHVVG